LNVNAVVGAQNLPKDVYRLITQFIVPGRDLWEKIVRKDLGGGVAGGVGEQWLEKQLIGNNEDVWVERFSKDNEEMVGKPIRDGKGHVVVV
jgi:hypothetical protein